MSLSALLEEHAPPGRPTVVTVGTFDGVHTGHRKLLQRVVEVAKASEDDATASVAIVFRKPPRAFLKPDAPISFLCPLQSRVEMVRAAGVDSVILADFDESVRTITPAEFVELLVDTLRMTDYIAGPGAVIGRDREGDADVMRELGEEHGFTLHTVGPEIYDGKAVSSTHIRSALAGGRMAEVAGMLGRRYTLTGTVETGDKRGRTIGFPTANLKLPDPEFPAALPADGIYATWATMDNREPVMAATSIGVRPTFEQDGKRTVEAFLLGFDEDIYGKQVTLEFVRRLRAELAFDTVEELVEQMNEDIENTRQLLAADKTPSTAVN